MKHVKTIGIFLIILLSLYFIVFTVILPKSNDSSVEAPYETILGLMKEEVVLVPVTQYGNYSLTDISDVNRVFVEEGLFPLVQDIVNISHITFLEGENEAKNNFLINPSEDVWLIPLHELTVQMRLLETEGIHLFEDPDNWPLVVRVPISDIPEGSFSRKDLQIESVVAGGTVVLSRGVAERIEKYNDSFYPWSGIAGIMQSASFAFLNFKGAIMSDCIYDGYTLEFCGQSWYLDGMKQAGVDGVSLSGNHIGDFGEKGMQDTLYFLDEQKIFHTGLGINQEANKPIITILGERENAFSIGILAYNSVFGTAPCVGTSTIVLGVNCLKDKKAVADEIQELKTQVDIVIVYANWGPEYVHQPDNEQIAWAKVFVESGADIVLGDQAHWVQVVKFYDGVPIFYGLGNLVFDQMWSEKTREGVIVRLWLVNGALMNVEPFAIKIYDFAQPRIEKEETARSILEYLNTQV